MKRLLGMVAVAAAALGAPRVAHAQDIEVPILVIEAPETDTGVESDDELDLANLVQTAAKGVTTVQEAPAIITIIPGDELRDRATRNMEETLDLVPGFMRYGAMHGQFAFATTRGTVQSMLFLRDSISMFDPWGNTPSIGRGVPMEMIKRIEIVSGPGGVLWGANSYLGIVNVITKDADDVDGIEASAGYGDGEGDASDFRGYAMTGQSFKDGKVKLLAHVSFDSFKGPLWKREANHMFSTPLPNPNSKYIYGPADQADPKRSMAFNFDGKLSISGLNLYWSLPYQEHYFGLTFPGGIVKEHLVEDDLPGGECSELAGGRNDPEVLNPTNPTERCIDRGRATRQNGVNWYDRYAMADYRTRFASGKAGLTFKGYFIQFLRQMDPIVILPAVPQLLEGGLAFSVNNTTYRAGGSFDGDIELTSKLRLLYGGEAFHEWVADNTTNSRQGAGAEATFWGPFDNSKLPLPCPHHANWNGTGVDMITYEEDCPLTFVFQTSRTTMGAYSAAQLRPVSKLILDAGMRLQAAPEVVSTDRSYGLVPIFSGAAVYEFLPDFHLKLNIAEGFRAPVFNNTDSNGEAVEIDGDVDLAVETSRSYQGEINARVLKGKKRIRELDVRVDYSYTTLHNFITFVGGRYDNVGDRGISSAEFLAKLYLKGDHRVELGYTYVKIDMDDTGAFLSMPENYFNLSFIANLVPGKLEGLGIVKVVGGFEDPNRRVDARGLMIDPETGNASPANAGQTVIVEPYELVIDRIPPGAELQIGLRYRMLKDKLILSANMYNALNANRYQPDAFSDLQPRLEILPTSYEAFRFFASATLSY